MNTKKLAILASLLVVVSLSGCVGGGGGRASGISTGVIIKDFYPGISEIHSGDSVIFSMMVENVGGEDATNVEARLFGLGTDWKVDGKEYEVGDLEKSQPDDDIPGGTADVQWDATSPANLKVDNSYTAVARLSYRYKTTAVANLRVYNYDYLQSNAEEAEEIMQSSGLDSFTVTDAPLSVDLAGVARPLIYRESDGEPPQASLTFLIENVGQGQPFFDLKSDHSDESNMKIRIDKITINKVSACENLEDEFQGDYLTRLPRSGKKSVPCKFDLVEVEDYSTIPVEIVITYDYWIDAETDVSVLKSLFPEDETYTTTPFECDDHEECCSNYGDGPCDPEKAAHCDTSTGECYCGSDAKEYDYYDTCPPDLS